MTNSLSIDNLTLQLINKEHLYAPKADAKGLTQIAVSQTIIHATDTLRLISTLMDSEKNVQVKNLYMICEVAYENLVNEFSDASLALAEGDYRSVLFYVGKCDRFVTDCRDVIGKKRAPQLRDQNSQNRVLVQMSLFSGELIV
ncbi:invertase/pectin methylesterase inhibitor family protein [Striga asiatica]|uniref:Invertase/pectin methylesterase inhibitor family protein n=1 Tax=Striga asiatica TaxID=4170 RepID=A0A5A7R9M0_STRAF|nr:invertase/pectin methylesterase inhibitor family protein [Striga asiatica]